MSVAVDELSTVPAVGLEALRIPHALANDAAADGRIVVEVTVTEQDIKARSLTPEGEQATSLPNTPAGVDRLQQWGKALKPDTQPVFKIESVGPHYGLVAAILHLSGATIAITVRCYIGLDVGKFNLDAVVKLAEGSRHLRVPNTPAGIDKLHKWTQKLPPSAVPVWIMESTGSYHLLPAVILHGLGHRVSIANPARPKAWAKSKGKLNKTDKCDAAMLTEWAEKCEPREWAPAPAAMQELRALVKRLLQVMEHYKREWTRLHENPRVVVYTTVARSIQRALDEVKAERKALQKEIEAFYAAHEELRKARALLMTIPGVGKIAADNLLCLILHRGLRSASEAAALCGVVPVHRQSGKTLNAPARISNEGDANVRAALFMPALSATVHSGEAKEFYSRLVARGLPKKAAVIAVMHRMVRVAFGVLRSGQPYTPREVFPAAAT